MTGAVVQAITSSLALRIFTRFTDGPVRYRLAWASGGRSARRTSASRRPSRRSGRSSSTIRRRRRGRSWSPNETASRVVASLHRALAARPRRSAVRVPASRALRVVASDDRGGAGSSERRPGGRRRVGSLRRLGDGAGRAGVSRAPIAALRHRRRARSARSRARESDRGEGRALGARGGRRAHRAIARRAEPRAHESAIRKACPHAGNGERAARCDARQRRRAAPPRRSRRVGFARAGSDGASSGATWVLALPSGARWTSAGSAPSSRCSSRGRGRARAEAFRRAASRSSWSASASGERGTCRDLEHALPLRGVEVAVRRGSRRARRSGPSRRRGYRALHVHRAKRQRLAVGVEPDRHGRARDERREQELVRRGARVGSPSSVSSSAMRPMRPDGDIRLELRRRRPRLRPRVHLRHPRERVRARRICKSSSVVRGTRRCRSTPRTRRWRRERRRAPRRASPRRARPVDACVAQLVRELLRHRDDLRVPRFEVEEKAVRALPVAERLVRRQLRPRERHRARGKVEHVAVPVERAKGEGSASEERVVRRTPLVASRRTSRSPFCAPGATVAPRVAARSCEPRQIPSTGRRRGARSR